jgi:N-acetylmuramoyl-L-alanine amidase
MRLRAAHFFYVLAYAPVLAAVVLSGAPTVEAKEQPPQPYVVAVDPGHGGTPNNSNPDQPFDSGAIAVNGLLEKDLTLDVAKRLRHLLEGDEVEVAMTREDDRYVPIPARTQTAMDAKASLFVSVHFNSFTDPSTGGSLVLFPSQASQPFAQTMSDALGRRLGPAGVPADGIQLRDNWWISATMPVVTVEALYLTNPQEAARAAQPDFRQRIAEAVHDGILAYRPGIATRKAQIVAWNAEHPTEIISVSKEGDAGLSSGLGNALRGMFSLGLRAVMVLAVALAVVWQRRRLASALALSTQLFEGSLSRSLVRRPAARRRRRRLRQRSLRTREEVTRPRSVYDELWF